MSRKAAADPHKLFEAIGSAPVLLDALILGRVDGALVSIMHYAMIAAQQLLRQRFKRIPRTRYSAATWHFMAAGGEWDARCLYCQTSLNSIGYGSAALPKEFTAPMDRHGEECALRFLMLTADELATARNRSGIAVLLRKKIGLR